MSDLDLYQPRPATRVQHPAWSQRAVIYQINTRQFTVEGTLAAAQAQLPRLQQFQLGFRVGLERYAQVLGDKLAEMVVSTAVFLLFERSAGIGIDQRLALLLQRVDPLLAGGTAKQRHLGVA